MKRKFGLMFAMVVTLAVMWFSTTGAAWASPASGTVPSGGPYRIFVVSEPAKPIGHATYELAKPIGKAPVGLKFLLQSAVVKTYDANWKPAGGKVIVCGLVKPAQKGQIYKLVNKIKWVALSSSSSVSAGVKMVCALTSSGKFVVIGK